MEKITKEEFISTPLHRRGRTSHFYNEMLKLKPDEGLTIYKKEWRAHYAPTQMANRIAKRYGYKFEQGALLDRSGWRVLRVK
jgi:hypothetical protein